MKVDVSVNDLTSVLNEAATKSKPYVVVVFNRTGPETDAWQVQMISNVNPEVARQALREYLEHGVETENLLPEWSADE